MEKNVLSEPKITKITVNMGVGRLKDDKNFIASAKGDLALITGQAPCERRAKKSIAGFKLREGDTVGVMVTLRRKRMWDFFSKLIYIVLSRLRDFRGISKKSFDGSGNYSLGISEHTVFPEVDANKVDKIKSLQVTFCVSTKSNEEGYKYLKFLGMPFKD